MELKAGYKLTEVGVIPEDWEIKRVNDIATVGSGGTPRREVAAYWGGSIPWVTTSQINFGLITEADQFITAEGLQNSAAKLVPAGTLLMALYGQGKTRGKVGLLAMQAATNQACAAISLRNDVSRDFLLFFLTSRYEHIRNSSNSGSQENLSGSIVKSIFIAFPSLPEQKAIATALSDTDALIESLEQLIAKKRLIKQGTMQELLTGKRRLPGFGGEWEVKRLGDFGSTFGGLTGKTKSDFGEGTSRYITFMNIMENVVIDCGIFELVNISSAESQNRVNKGDLFFNGSSETPEEVGMCSVLAESVKDVYLNSFCFGFRFREDAKADGLYFAYYFRSLEGRDLLKSLAQGATRYNLSKTALLKVTFPVPTIEEQTAIATLLSDLDTELTALESQLEKTRAIKQGMMQALLTGRIRLLKVSTPC